MKIRTNITIQGGRYQAQIDTLDFTANEQELIAEFGEPLVDIGSLFTGTVSVPGWTNTVITVTPTNGGANCVAVPVLNPDGSIASITVSNGGSGYNATPTIQITGAGNGAAAHAVVNGGVVTQILLDSSGTGYQQVPYTLNWTEDTALRRLQSDFPIVKVYDLADFPDAAARIKIATDTIVSRLTTAKAGLLTQATPYTGETLTTV